MYNLINDFLSIPVGGRAAIFTGILLLLWFAFGRLILKLVSILPWILKKIFFGIYLVLEIPVSILHTKFGSIFGKIDQWLTTQTEKVFNFMEAMFRKMNKPKTIHSKWAFVIYLILAAYLLIPISANLTEKRFTFWQKSYVNKETEIIQWMDNKGWFERQ
jgi:hypothetical protein